MNEELVLSPGMALSVSRPPAQVLEEARIAAKALMGVIDAKPVKDKVIMNGVVYLEFEDWQTVARFFNTTSRVKSTNYVEFGPVRGFEAMAEAIVIMDGVPVVVGATDAMCLSDEENWGDRPKYEWQEELDKDGKVQWVDGPNGKRPKKKKVLIGSEPTPLFQLRSMAQTRAQAKVLRSLFSWVVVLANNAGAKISTTPAEEMDGGTVIEGDDKPAVAQPQRSQSRPGTKISEGQRKRMYAMARESGFDPDTRVKEVITAYGYASEADVVRGKNEGEYDFICLAIQNKTWTPPAKATNGSGEAAKPQLTPVVVEGKCTGIHEVPAEGDKDSFIVAHFGGKEVHCFDHKTFDLVRSFVDKDCKLNCGMREGFPNKVKLLGVLKVGEKEWDETGLPVIQVRESQAETPFPKE